VWNSPTCLNFLNTPQPWTHNLENWRNVTTLWTVFFCAYQIPSSRDTHAQSLRGAYITQHSPLPLTTFPNIFPLSWAFSFPARLHPPRDLSSFLFFCFQHVSSYLPVVIVWSPPAFLPFLFVLSLRPLAFSHAGNSNSCRNCVFPQDSYSSWLPCDLHLQSSLEVWSYLI
jgi:hypothetical protein